MRSSRNLQYDAGCMFRTIAALVLTAAVTLAAPKPVEIFFIDVEGGQATLLVSPNKESLLIDTGWPGFEDRDANRIAKVAKKAGIKKIDYLLITHYHLDHVGGITQLLQKMPVGTFIDKGPNRETGDRADKLYQAYLKAVETTGKRITVKPGDKLPVKGLDITVVAADGVLMQGNLPGGGQTNPLCAAAEQKQKDPTENALSTGILVQLGKFRFVDLADLTWNKELELACPANRIGPVDLYLTTHHGLDQSGPKELVHALRPRVAVMNNGARKGGSPSAWKVVKSSPGLEDLWQLHYSVAGGTEANVPDSFIADTNDVGEGNYVQVTALPDGSMTVFNSRNKFSRKYAAK